MSYKQLRFPLTCAAALVTAYLSQIFLSQPWFLLAIEGRSFRSEILLNILGCVPFLWPFVVTGVLFARHALRPGIGFVWALCVGIVGGVLYSRIVTLLIPASDSVFHH